MNIVIHTSMNGVGLQKDYHLLKAAIGSEHTVTLHDRVQHNFRSDFYDVAFHLEIPEFRLFKFAKRNIFIPNSEWFGMDWLRKIHTFDEVWCKTKDCLRTFSTIHKNCKLSGFYSEDMRIDGVTKDRIAIHPAGKSETKSTNEIIQAYRRNKDLLPCFIFSANHHYEKINNLVVSPMVAFDDVRYLYNVASVIICTSQYEGWGHYLHEGFSCSAAVLLSDHPPMNEFCQDERMLVKRFSTRKMSLADIAVMDSQDIEQALVRVSQLSDNDLLEIGKKNRAYFDKCKSDFYSFVKSELC